MTAVPADQRRIVLYDVSRFFAAVSELILALRECDDLPAPVMGALDELRRQVARMGARDAGPPP